jgi:glucan phosphorylase
VSPRHRIPQPPPGTLDERGIVDAFAHRMMYSVAKDHYTATDFNVYQALAYAVRDRLMERWFRTQSAYYQADAKRVYYLSLEFLLGRLLVQNVINLGALDAYTDAMLQLGYDLEALQEREWDAGLGNGGLGRLAACIMDSAATLGLPFYGYGIRYEYGIFQQRFENGFQMEAPDHWLRYGNPWEIPRPDVIFPVRFYGRRSLLALRCLDGHGVADAHVRDLEGVPFDQQLTGGRGPGTLLRHQLADSDLSVVLHHEELQRAPVARTGLDAARNDPPGLRFDDSALGEKRPEQLIVDPVRPQGRRGRVRS